MQKNNTHTQQEVMMISKRASTIEDSITMAISATAKKMKKEGLDVLSFSAGEPDFHTPDHIKKAGIDAIHAGKLFYTPASGILELKEAVCEKFKIDQNLDYDPGQIIISSGAKHSLYNIFQAIIDPGDEVIIPSPYWVSYPAQVTLNDGIPVIIETSDASNFKITAHQLRSAINPKTKCLILTSPSNPTGAVYTKQELIEIAKIAVENNIFIISDEIYEKLIYEGQHISIAQLGTEIKDQTIVVNGVSKAYSMTGWRIGYLAANHKIASAINKIQSQTTSNPATPSQWASIQALKHGENDIKTMKSAFDTRRKLMVELLNNIDGISCIKPQGAFYAFPNISACFGKTTSTGSKITSSFDFSKYLLEEKLVAVIPGSGFGSDNYIRLSYATSESDIKKGLQRITEFVTSLA